MRMQIRRAPTNPDAKVVGFYPALPLHANSPIRGISASFSVLRQVFHLQRRRDGNAVTDGAGNRAVVSVQTVGTHCRLAFVGGKAQVIRYVNAPHNQHIPLLFDLADRLRGESSFSSRNIARLQRASQGTRKSTGGRSYEIVQGCGVRFEDLWIHAVMLSDLRVNAEIDRFRLYRQIGSAQRAFHALYAHVGAIYDSFVHRRPPLK
jgi:hypothetical protein